MTYENIGAPPPEAAGGGERKLGAALEGDLAEFVQSINGWYERINGQIVPTADDVPEGYRLATYVAFQPVDARLAQYMEIKNRGAPVVLCAQDDEAKKIWNKRLSVYTANESIDTAMRDLRLGPAGSSRNMTPQEDLVRNILQGSIHDVFLRPEWRSQPNNNALMDKYPGIVWAEEHGLAEAAFMSSTLYYYQNLQQTGQEDLRSDKYGASALHLYEELAAQLDDEGRRKFKPLTLEQIAGFGLSTLNQALQNDPSLNERLHLTAPLQPNANDPDNS